MEQGTMLLGLTIAAGVMSSLFGLLFLVTPEVVHRLNQGISRSILTFDTILVKYNRVTGVLFLAVGVFLLYMTISAR